MFKLLVVCCLLVISKNLAKPGPYLNAGFTGAGLYTPYHFGVVYSLIAKGVLDVEKTNVAGSSGGGITAAFFKSKLLNTVKLTFEYNKILYETCSLTTTCLEKGLAYVARKVFVNVLPKHAHKQCRTGVYVHLNLLNSSKAVPTIDDPDCLKNHIGSIMAEGFTSRKELIQALVATSFVAGISEPHKCLTTFRGLPVNDGGYSVELPCPPTTSASKPCLKISVVPKQRWSDWSGKGGGGVGVTEADIYPGIRPANFSYAPVYVVPVDEYLELMFDSRLVYLALSIFDVGRQDGLFWAETHGY